MRTCRTALLLACLLTLCAFLPPGYAQTDLAPPPVDPEKDPVGAALQALRASETSKMSKAREVLVRLGKDATPRIIEELKQVRGTDQILLAGQYILALGEIGDEAATEVLLEELAGSTQMLVYQAATALGAVWRNRGRVPADVREINARLLALMHGDWPPIVYRSGGLALIAINGEIRRSLPTRRPPAGIRPEKLREHIDDWFAKHPDSLPAMAERPWQLNLNAMQHGATQQIRRQAAEALRQAQKFEPIDPILRSLAQEDGVSQEVRQELSRLLGDLTNIPFSGEGEAAVEAWRLSWFEELKDKPDVTHVAYTWRALESAVSDYYQKEPDDKTVEFIKYLRAVLVHQLPGPEGIPDAASQNARRLIEAPVTVKHTIAEAYRTYEATTERLERQKALLTVTKQFNQPPAKELDLGIGMQFLQRTADLAYAEPDKDLAITLGGFMGKITGVPCDLDQPELRQRRKAMHAWAKEVHARDIAVKLPELEPASTPAPAPAPE